MISRNLIGSLIPMAERRILPDSLIRLGIRKLSARRLVRFGRASEAERAAEREEIRDLLRNSAVAEATQEANDQHYELPPAFFEAVLGPHLKYSSCLWENGAKDLGEAEAASLEASCEHAELADGQRILELGCGWGSLSTWMAERYPNARITSVSNSAPQREFITARARERGLDNLEVVTADINAFEPGETFDRIVSIEMFEHVRNYPELFSRIDRWLKPGGKLFVHVFRHETIPYSFETEDRADWMSQYFFTGGVMPSHDLLPGFATPLTLEADWRWDGTHYQRTAEAWLDNIDREESRVMPVMSSVYGADEARKWFQRWRIFFMSCAELFGYDRGREWGVSHYRFAKPVA